MHTMTRVKYLGNPFDEYSSNYFYSVQFTCNNKYILALLGAPDWVVLCYHWQKGKIISRFNALPSAGTGPISKVMSIINNKIKMHKLCLGNLTVVISTTQLPFHPTPPYIYI